MKKTLSILGFTFIIAVSLIVLMAVDLPGINVEDKYPNGCVDCHANTADADYRLNTELKNLEGHPDITAIVKTVPKDCSMCHKPGVPAGALTGITHVDHYQEPGENVFVQQYEGSCLACHAIDTGTGDVSMKNGPKNW